MEDSQNQAEQLPISYLNQEDSIGIDKYFMDDLGYPTLVLMELAGQSIGACIETILREKKSSKILLICGPGNNGGDGMVAARHLKRLGFSNLHVFLFKSVKKILEPVLAMVEAEEIPVTYFKQEYTEKGLTEAEIKQKLDDLFSGQDLIVDAILGYSFKPPLREPYGTVIRGLKNVEAKVLSVDVPSGWNVETGKPEGEDYALEPGYNISMMLPKLGVKGFKGRHFIGGNFMNDGVLKKFGINRPHFKNAELFTEVNESK